MYATFHAVGAPVSKNIFLRHCKYNIQWRFKKLSVGPENCLGLRYCVLHNVVSFLNKGLPPSYLGEKIIRASVDALCRVRSYIWLKTSTQLHKGYFAKNKFSAVALVRDADVDMA